MTLNEQGLAENNELREVVCSSEFRAIFLVDRKSLRDGGRDVSRALRNRCMEITLDYSEEEDQGLESDALAVAREAEEMAQVQEERIIDPFYS